MLSMYPAPRYIQRMGLVDDADSHSRKWATAARTRADHEASLDEPLREVWVSELVGMLQQSRIPPLPVYLQHDRFARQSWLGRMTCDVTFWGMAWSLHGRYHDADRNTSDYVLLVPDGQLFSGSVTLMPGKASPISYAGVHADHLQLWGHTTIVPSRITRRGGADLRTRVGLSVAAALRRGDMPVQGTIEGLSSVHY
jgi:hypothetical protein